ncbi:hypothetical protein ACNKHM_21725 [Shigella sonnei]
MSSLTQRTSRTWRGAGNDKEMYTITYNQKLAACGCFNLSRTTPIVLTGMAGTDKL